MGTWHDHSYVFPVLAFRNAAARATGVDPGGRYTNTNPSLRVIFGSSAKAVVIGPQARVPI